MVVPANSQPIGESIENNVSFCRGSENEARQHRYRTEYSGKVKVQNNLMTIAVMPDDLEESNILSV